jgi:hypothetical protein
VVVVARGSSEEQAMSERERRGSPRYAPVRDAVQLGWWEGADFRTAPGQLTDLSHGGAALIAEFPVVESDAFWVRLVRAGPSGWVPASVAGVEASELGGERVRLAFPEPCPYDFFRAVVFGTPPAPGLAPARPAATPATVRPEPYSPPSERPAGASGGWVSVELARMDSAAPAPRRTRVKEDHRDDLASHLRWCVPLVVNVAVVLLRAVAVITQLSSLRLSDRIVADLGP